MDGKVKDSGSNIDEKDMEKKMKNLTKRHHSSGGVQTLDSQG